MKRGSESISIAEATPTHRMVSLYPSISISSLLLVHSNTIVNNIDKIRPSGTDSQLKLSNFCAFKDFEFEHENDEDEDGGILYDEEDEYEDDEGGENEDEGIP